MSWKEILSLFAATVIGGVSGVIIALVMLPAIVTNLTPTLDSLSIVGVSNVVGWLGNLIILIILTIVAVLLTRLQFYRGSILYNAVLTSALLGALGLCWISYYWIISIRPDLFVDVAWWEKLLRFYSYPSLLSIEMGSPQVVWILACSLHVFFFNLKYFWISYRQTLQQEQDRIYVFAK